MATVLKPKYTLAEYFAREAASPDKHEYYRGEIFAMAGASPAHNSVSDNIFGNLFMQLRGRDCRPKGSNVLVNADSLYTYPDVSVVCPPIERESAPIETILNPRVVVEVLSSTTERYDRNVKFPHYQRTLSVREILLVQQDAAVVECYLRQADGSWGLTRIEELSGEVTLASIGCRLALADIYANVEFPLNPFTIVLG